MFLRDLADSLGTTWFITLQCFSILSHVTWSCLTLCKFRSISCTQWPARYFFSFQSPKKKQPPYPFVPQMTDVSLFAPFFIPCPQCIPGLKYTTNSRGLNADNRFAANTLYKWSCRPHSPTSVHYCKAETMQQHILTYATYNARLYISYIGVILTGLHCGFDL